MPVTGYLHCCTWNRIKKITKQIFLSFKIFDQDVNGIFLVVPHLATPVILGDDWLSQYGVVINYTTHSVEFPQWNQSCVFQSSICSNPISSVSNLNVHYSSDTPTLPLDQCHASLYQLDQYLCSSQPESLDDTRLCVQGSDRSFRTLLKIYSAIRTLLK